MPRTLRWMCLASLLACAFLSGCWEKAKTTAWSNATGAESFERLMWDDIKAKNWNSVEQHLGAAFVLTTPEGIYNRDRTMEYLKGGFDVEDYSMGDLNVWPAGNDMVVTYTITLRGTENGKPLPSTPVHMMTVWQQVKRGWIAVAHSSVPSSQPAVASATEPTDR